MKRRQIVACKCLLPRPLTYGFWLAIWYGSCQNDKVVKNFPVWQRKARSTVSENQWAIIFVGFFSKRCLAENIQGKSSATLILLKESPGAYFNNLKKENTINSSSGRRDFQTQTRLTIVLTRQFTKLIQRNVFRLLPCLNSIFVDRVF